MSSYLLAGDIGGTNSRLALYTSPSFEERPTYSYPLFLRKYVNEIHLPTDTHLWEHEILLPFLQEAMDQGILSSTPNIVACLAVAGPVDTLTNRVTMTNILRTQEPHSCIVLDGSAIESSTHSLLQHIHKCILINDFIGQGYGLLTLPLDSSQLVELIPGSFARIDPHAPKACVGAGTGLGQCFLVPSGSSSYTCFPSEGGHVDYAPRTPFLNQLNHYLLEKYHEPHRVSVERIVSGRGLADVYDFLTMTFPSLVQESIQKEYSSCSDAGKFIGERTSRDGLCKLAMNIVMEAYGAEVGNATLKFLPKGGMYVCGGLTPKNLHWIQGATSPFMRAFRDKGRLSSLVSSIPLFAVLDDDLGLYGAWFMAVKVHQTI